MLSLIVAIGNNRMIGSDNDMPWHIPKDLQYFKEVTNGHTIIMGRKTFESIGRPLPNRRNIVLTRQELNIDGVEVIHELNDIFKIVEKHPNDEIFIGGGGNLYEQTISHADRLYITHIDEDFEGDTLFPEFSKSEWKQVSKTKGEKDDKNPYDYYFTVYDRI